MIHTRSLYATSGWPCLLSLSQFAGPRPTRFEMHDLPELSNLFVGEQPDGI